RRPMPPGTAPPARHRPVTSGNVADDQPHGGLTTRRESEEDTTMTITCDQAYAQMSRMTDLGIRATAAEMRAAAYLIACETRQAHPTAVQVHLEPSDQGDFLCLDDWSDA